MSLVAELKRRNVFKVAAAYLALGWVVTQVTAAVVPALNLPTSLNAMVVWLGIAAFPFVLAFSWIYELTPEGLKRESDVDRSSSITQHTGRKLDYLIVGLLVAAIAITALDRLMPRSAGTQGEATAGAGLSANPASSNAATSSSPASALTQSSSPVTAPDRKSIAVLPFVNMSSDTEQEYFSDGISEELLNQLAKIAELKVSARTSSFSYKGKDTKIATIGQELHVANVLEGSVRKSGDKVRITAQLVRAADGYHLWSETYDRKIEDIFAVQDEIAGAVVAQLKITLLGEVPKTRETTPEAYALYLQARALGRQLSPESLEQSNGMLNQVLAIDPSYAPAWTSIATNHVNQVSFGMLAADKGAVLARDAALKALALDPDHALAHGSLGWIALMFEHDIAGAAQHFGRALAINPRDPRMLGNASVLLLRLGRIDTAIAMLEFAVAQDPVVPARHNNLGTAYEVAGRFDDALTSLRAAVRLSPQYGNIHAGIGGVLLLKGDAQAALLEYEQATQPAARLEGLAMAYHSLGRTAESDAALDELTKGYEEESAWNIARVYAWRHEADRAFEWLDRAVNHKSQGLSATGVDRVFANIADDPRWLPFLRGIGVAPEQLAAIEFDVKVPQQ